MKITGVLVLSVVVIAVLFASEGVSALPTRLQEKKAQLTDLEPLFEHVDDNGGDSNAGIRQARVTCDLLSFKSKWLSPNHSACAARCLAQRKKGGSCRNGVCHCRK